MMRVSVVIPTFNRAEPLKRAIRSVLEQTFAPFEIVVVDDGSSDRTPEVLARFGNAVSPVFHPANRGVAAARNTGIRKSSGSLVAFLDSDDYWLPGKLATQVALFLRRPRTVACQTEEIWLRRGRRVNPRRKHRKPSGDLFYPSLELCLISPSAVALRRSLLDEVGLFDEALPACEDYDLWLRIACRHPVELIREPLVVREGGHPDQLSSRFEGLDRFRVRALVKLVRSGRLRPPQREAALRALEEKCRVYGEGCRKRGRPFEGGFYLELPGRLRGHPARPGG